MLLTSEQHARLAQVCGRPNSNRSPEEEEAARESTHHHAIFSKLALSRELKAKAAGTHRGDGDQTRSRASQTMEDISHASWDDAEERDKP